MAATIYGDVTFGVTEEVGVYTQSVEASISIEDAQVKNGGGTDVGGSYYNSSVTGTINGVLRTSGTAFGAKVGAEVTLANSFAFGSYVGNGYSSGGKTITRSLRFPRENQGFRTVEHEFDFKPFYS